MTPPLVSSTSIQPTAGAPPPTNPTQDSPSLIARALMCSTPTPATIPLHRPPPLVSSLLRASHRHLTPEPPLPLLPASNLAPEHLNSPQLPLPAASRTFRRRRRSTPAPSPCPPRVSRSPRGWGTPPPPQRRRQRRPLAPRGSGDAATTARG